MGLIARRNLALIALSCVVLSALFLLTTSEVHGQEYPTRTIVLVVPWPAGGTMDVAARMLGRELADRLGKPAIVENRPRAGAGIGAPSPAPAATERDTVLLRRVTGR